MPTWRQIKAVKNLVENGGSIRQAMKDAGYSQTMADNPKRLTQSKSFRALLDDCIPEEEVSKQLRNLLHASKVEHYVFPLSVTDEEIKEIVESINGCTLKKIKHGEQMTYAYYWTPDNRSKKDALDMILKVRGHYAPQKISLQDDYDTWSSDDLDKKIAELQNKVQAKRVDTDPQTTDTQTQ